MEPLERRYFADDDRADRVREARAGRRRPRLGYDFAPASGGDGALAPRTGRDGGDHYRPDARIKEDVCRWLMDDPRLDASEIDVEVHDGGVILRGTVVGRCKRLAYDIAAGVPGVREVVSLLQVDGLAA
jgi:hypothetical protein